MGISTCNSICSEKRTPVRVIVGRTRDSVTDIFTKYRRKLGDGARQAVERARSRHRDNLIMQPRSQCMIEEYRLRKSIGCEEIATGFLLLMILLMLLLGLYLVRRYNHTFAYGSGGCLSTIFWTYEECIIVT
ncbi:uncharacterized protein LOC108136049 [Drosophila elegans]|uniref:uncharacterized protein LOC108136049 n=1 Tax=Drosophila elegans TaxID=30023 RepID=UPI0007E6150E|nr:uncharacterized protein LOC108136049 [Drosophila elegans]